jgi:hypothetical protein
MDEIDRLATTVNAQKGELLALTALTHALISALDGSQRHRLVASFEVESEAARIQTLEMPDALCDAFDDYVEATNARIRR